MLKGILHFFLEIGSFYHTPRVKQLGFTVFKSIQPIIRRISVPRQFLVSLTSIVGKKIYTMEVNETRNCLGTDNDA